jgi:hypothetical protein
VHLASVRSAQAANTEWQSLTRRYRQLQNQQLVVREVEIPGQGRYWRVMTTTSSRDEAVKLCRSLAASKQYCQPIRA